LLGDFQSAIQADPAHDKAAEVMLLIRQFPDTIADMPPLRREVIGDAVNELPVLRLPAAVAQQVRVNAVNQEAERAVLILAIGAIAQSDRLGAAR
jgi:hypothetical protein